MKCFAAAAILGSIFLSACSQKEAEPAKAVSEVKGKPIAAPVAPAQTNLADVIAASNLVVTNLAATNVVEVKATNAEPVMVNGYLQVGFDRLAAYHYIMPGDTTNAPPADQFPPTIKALDQKPIALRGFMLPLRVDQGLVTEMLIMRDQSMCCFGTSPKINEWVSVKMNEKGVKPVMDQPVTLFGKLRVGEMRENGYLVGIYQLDGEKMEWEQN